MLIVASHLPYTVQFRPKDGRPGSSRNLSIIAEDRPLLQLKSVLARHETPKTPYNSAATPMPNLLESLGRGSSPTPPLTPSAMPSGEELFFRILNRDTALGSPSDPSRAARRTAPSAAAVRPKATPFLPIGGDSPTAEGGGGKAADSGYFDLPIGSVGPDRPTRRRPSAASGGSADPTGSEDWVVEKTDFGNGGLKHAVEASSDPSEKVYVGTLGFGTDDIDESTKVAIEGRLREDYSCLVAFTSNADFNGHYEHYCKEVCARPISLRCLLRANHCLQVLWPVFHYLIPDHHKSKYAFSIFFFSFFSFLFSPLPLSPLLFPPSLFRSVPFSAPSCQAFGKDRTDRL